MILYRIVRTNPPTQDDFVPRPTPARSDPETVRLSHGLSVFRTLEQARNRQRRAPFLGRWIAILDVAEGDEIRFERTTMSRGHYTVWGDPWALLGCVTEVVDVS